MKTEIDLFENYKKQPENLKKICDYWQDKAEYTGLSYNDCKEFLNQVEAIGYTFEYYLDAQPYNLKKISHAITNK